MPEEVTFDTERQLILVRSWGECGIQDWNSSKDQVLQLSSKHGCNKLLVDVREQEATPSTTDIFWFVKSWPNSIRVALLVGKETQEEQRFLETVAVNREIPMQDFTEENEAIEWLNR